jgi:hypothetical protein
LDLQGLQIVIQLVGYEDSKINSAACLALAKGAKSPEAQTLARDLGVLPLLMSNLVSNDILISSSAAGAIATISRNGYFN